MEKSLTQKFIEGLKAKHFTTKEIKTMLPRFNAVMVEFYSMLDLAGLDKPKEPIYKSNSLRRRRRFHPFPIIKKMVNSQEPKAEMARFSRMRLSYINGNSKGGYNV